MSPPNRMKVTPCSCKRFARLRLVGLLFSRSPTFSSVAKSSDTSAFPKLLKAKVPPQVMRPSPPAAQTVEQADAAQQPSLHHQAAGPLLHHLVTSGASGAHVPTESVELYCRQTPSPGMSKKFVLASTGGMSVGSIPFGPNSSAETLVDWLLQARAKNRSWYEWPHSKAKPCGACWFKPALNITAPGPRRAEWLPASASAASSMLHWPACPG